MQLFIYLMLQLLCLLLYDCRETTLSVCNYIPDIFTETKDKCGNKQDRMKESDPGRQRVIQGDR